MQTNILKSTANDFKKNSFEMSFGVFLTFFWVVAFLFIQKWKVKNIAFKVLSWPPQSPDLSPIEDIWGIMSEKVYKNGKTYPNVEELWYAVVGAFFQIPLETFQKLYQSMYTRLIKVLESGGKRIKY